MFVLRELNSSFTLSQVLWASQAVGLSRGVQPGGAAPAAEPDHDTSSQGRGAQSAAPQNPPAYPL